MTDDKDHLIKTLQKKILKLESTLKIVASHSGKTENRMIKQFEVLWETIPVPMIISNENERIVFVNSSAQKTFGYSFEDFTLIEESSLYNNPEERELFLETLSNKGEVKGVRVELRKSQDSVFPAVLFSQRINFDGQDSILNVVHDLTEIMNLERQLRQTQKMEAIGNLTSGIAHDFNNILAAIFGYTELIKKLLDPEKDKKKGDYLDKVQKAAARARSMIMQMMDFCRQSEKKKRAFYISSVVAEVIKMMINLTPSDITIQPDIRNKDMVVMGDPTQIHQVVTNLITNSVHALSDKGGKIEVILEKTDIVEQEWGDEILIPRLESGIYARITVKDNGPGISEEIIHNVFDPFFSTKPLGEGSGMGLAVVHGIVQEHNGSLNVESEVGKGTSLHCYFPVTVTDEDYEIVAPAFESEIIGKGDERILVVDDDPMILEVCSEILQSAGYHVAACGASWEALEVFRAGPDNFDLIITDKTMPGMSGTELTRKILKIRPDIRIILITGIISKDESELKKMGIRAVIKKPFNVRQLQSVTRKILDDEK